MKYEQIKAMCQTLSKNICLPDFIESETGCRIIWKQPDMSACTICPMPWHDDSKASFFMNRMDDDTWVWHCFGCDAAGTIITFCLDYLGKENVSDAIKYLAEKYEIGNITETELMSYKFVINRVDEKTIMEGANILASSQCRALLRANFDIYKKWVADAYKRLNHAVNTENMELIEDIGHEASMKLQQEYERKK